MRSPGNRPTGALLRAANVGGSIVSGLTCVSPSDVHLCCFPSRRFDPTAGGRRPALCDAVVWSRCQSQETLGAMVCPQLRQFGAETAGHCARLSDRDGRPRTQPEFVRGSVRGNFCFVLLMSCQRVTGPANSIRFALIIAFYISTLWRYRVRYSNSGRQVTNPLHCHCANPAKARFLL